MMRIAYAFFIFLFLQLFAGCGNDAQRMQMQFSRQTDSLLNDTTYSSQKVDSLKKEIRKASSDTAVIHLLAELSFSVRSDKPFLAEDVEKMSAKLNYTYGIIEAQTSRGYSYLRMYDFHSADSVFRIALKASQEKGFTDLETQNLLFIGDMLRLDNKNDSALLVLNQALALSRKHDNKKLEANALNALGEAHRNKSEHVEAIKCFEEGLNIARAINDKGRISNCLGGLSSIYRAQDNYATALDYVQQSLAVSRAMKDKRNEASALNIIGALYFQQNDLEKANTYFQQALKLSEELKDNVRVTNCNLNIGAVYDQKKDYGNALRYYLRAYSIAKETKNKEYESYALSAIGGVYRAQDDFEQARGYNEEALDLARETGNIAYITNDLYNSALDFKGTGDLKSAVEAGESSLTESYRGGSPEDTKKIAELLYGLYDTLGNYEKAFAMHKLYTQMKDSVTNVKQVKKFAAAEFKEKEQGYKEQKAKSDEALQREKSVRNGVVIFSIVVAGLALLVLFSLIRNKRARRIIEKQKEEVELQKSLVEIKQKEILDSINYAKRLQAAILPPVSQIEKSFPESFVLYHPKDIVAGDFYWMESIGDFTFIAAGDSTGHGVPGAMVSVVCSNALNQAVKEFGLTETGLILDKATDIVLETFARSEENVQDGMDISLLAINKKNKTAQWSGANNPLWYFEEGKSAITEIKPDKQPVGHSDMRKPFTTHHLLLDMPKTFYLLTDGFADQFGGPKGKKFKYRQLKNILLFVSHQRLKQQADFLEDSFLQWKSWPDENGVPKNLEQVDDMTIMGIRI